MGPAILLSLEVYPSTAHPCCLHASKSILAFKLSLAHWYFDDTLVILLCVLPVIAEVCAILAIATGLPSAVHVKCTDAVLLLACGATRRCTDTAKVLFTPIVMQQAAAHSNAHSHCLRLSGSCRQSFPKDSCLFCPPSMCSQSLGCHCQSWFPIASLGFPLPVLVSHCQSWFPIATLGFPLPVLARHCQSWFPIATLGFPIATLGSSLPVLVSRCQSWVPIASLGSPTV